MKSLTRFSLKGRLKSTDTSVEITADNRGNVATLTNESVVAVSADLTSYEMMEINAATGTLTVVKRGLDNSAVKTEVPALKKDWGPGTRIYVTALASDIFDADSAEPQTLAGLITFLANNIHNGAEVFNKPFKGPVFATLALMNAYTPVSNGVQGAFCSESGTYYDYKGGAWIERGDTGTPNGSESVAGKFEKATDQQMTTGAEVGETGAYLTATPKQVKSFVEAQTPSSLIITSDYPLGEPIADITKSCVFKETAPTFAAATTAQNI